jgi:hypothetical protein
MSKEEKEVSMRYEHLGVRLHVVNQPPVNSLSNFSEHAGASGVTS